MQINLNLDECDEWGCDRAIAAFKAGDGEAFAAAVSHRACLAFVFDNALQLKRRGMYESALLHGYTGAKGSLFGWSTTLLQTMFDFADRAKLLAAGDPLPDGNQFTIYRGASGRRGSRRVRGYSWTLDYNKAEWFAMRLDLSDPAVYRATIQRRDVLAYENDRHEQEIICRPRSVKRIRSLAAAA